VKILISISNSKLKFLICLELLKILSIGLSTLPGNDLSSQLHLLLLFPNSIHVGVAKFFASAMLNPLLYPEW